jgi:hypothetical protein
VRAISSSGSPTTTPAAQYSDDESKEVTALPYPSDNFQICCSTPPTVTVPAGVN